ncbi:MAG TPA: DinB family protein [Pirellulales bacterium]|nr:DinB family protein [Pirellulales bacterium]
MSTNSLGRPEMDEYHGPFARYVELVPERGVLDLLAEQHKSAVAMLQPLDEATANTLHPPYTWSIKEVIGHITDAERVFAYRALRAARGDTTPLPGFEENDYARQAHHGTFPHADLLSEFSHVRQASIDLFRHLDEAAWLRRVTASGMLLSVRAWAYVIVGHARHHLAIVARRLGQGSRSDQTGL